MNCMIWKKWKKCAGLWGFGLASFIFFNFPSAARSTERVEAEIIFSARTTESYRLMRVTQPLPESHLLVHRWGNKDLQRQVLTEKWAKELRGDFERLLRISTKSKKSLVSICTEPVEVRRMQVERSQSGWFCDSSLGPQDREVWRSTLARFRQVAERGWEPGSDDELGSPNAKVPTKKN